MIPADTPGVRVRRVADPMGCRAAGHAEVTLQGVRIPADHLLGGDGLSKRHRARQTRQRGAGRPRSRHRRPGHGLGGRKGRSCGGPRLPGRQTHGDHRRQQ
ncbi:hypothetical protein BV401_10660 [Streptomyces malaysiensis subsp. malaysiensis]|uniref:FAD-binding domain-containing protein n=1 Tax=Streptomyces autolyticus TaxID=75293 RepID=A0ABN4W5B5_9ACTN|nr:hypothetical protein BV401_10660 [Streptomyces autolyticus]